MSNVKTLTPATSLPDQKVIDKLEKALARAHEGKLREVVIIGSYEGGEYFQTYTFQNGPLLVGFLAMSMHAVMATMDEQADKSDED